MNKVVHRKRTSKAPIIAEPKLRRVLAQSTERKRRARHGKKIAEPEFKRRRMFLRDGKARRLVSRSEWWDALRERPGPIVGAINWLDHNADGFDKLALLIDAIDHMNERRDIAPDAANHVCVGITMLRDELQALRARLWP